MSGDIQLKSENWGCEKRCDVDLGHNDECRQSHYHSLIGQMKVLFYFLFLDSVGVRKQQQTSKHHNFNELNPTEELQKTSSYEHDVIMLDGL